MNGWMDERRNVRAHHPSKGLHSEPSPVRVCAISPPAANRHGMHAEGCLLQTDITFSPEVLGLRS